MQYRLSLFMQGCYETKLIANMFRCTFIVTKRKKNIKRHAHYVGEKNQPAINTYVPDEQIFSFALTSFL